ncbi:MAG: hypothetical protein LBE12_19565, partial [Planctomycetaceae bacterium]|nr:hypothetical protein [Planctomycetaceae bacterium]
GVPQLSQSPVTYEISTQSHGVTHGGLPLLHQISIRSGLYNALQRVRVLKLYLPYNKSDHLLNIMTTKNFIFRILELSAFFDIILEHAEFLRTKCTWCIPTKPNFQG